MTGLRIIIFAKAPVPGSVKTRLIPALGEAEAAALARRLLLGTIREATSAGVGPTEICADPHPTDTAWEGLLVGDALELSDQGEGDLGKRLARAAKRALDGGSAAMLVGSDCPSLDRRRLRSLASQLKEHDAAILPAVDGGYVALGLNRYHPSLFQGIAWSTATVADETIQRIEKLGWSLWVGEPLRDIDTFEDLVATGLA